MASEASKINPDIELTYYGELMDADLSDPDDIALLDFPPQSIVLSSIDNYLALVIVESDEKFLLYIQNFYQEGSIRYKASAPKEGLEIINVVKELIAKF